MVDALGTRSTLEEQDSIRDEPTSRRHGEPVRRSHASGRLRRAALRIVCWFLVIVAAITGFTYAKNMGWFSPFGIVSSSHDTQVVNAVERTEEVSLMQLGIQGIRQESQSARILGRSVPGTGKDLFVQYDYKAKLGIDGSQVRITPSGDHAYVISVPEFKLIGLTEPQLKKAVEDGGILSWVSDDFDELEIATKILTNADRDELVESNRDLLEAQTKVFYDRIITSIDPDVTTTYEFGS
jgi:hypothetical protein